MAGQRTSWPRGAKKCVASSYQWTNFGEAYTDNGDFRTRVGLIIDVKTQENQYTPQADWRCEVTDEQIGRPADIYVFCKLRIVGQAYTLYIVGWEYENDFKTNAIYRKRGDLLRGKPVHYPKWDITILELKTMNSLIPVII